MVTVFFVIFCQSLPGCILGISLRRTPCRETVSLSSSVSSPFATSKSNLDLLGSPRLFVVALFVIPLFCGEFFTASCIADGDCMIVGDCSSVSLSMSDSNECKSRRFCTLSFGNLTCPFSELMSEWAKTLVAGNTGTHFKSVHI